MCYFKIIIARPSLHFKSKVCISSKALSKQHCDTLKSNGEIWTNETHTSAKSDTHLHKGTPLPTKLKKDMMNRKKEKKKKRKTRENEKRESPQNISVRTWETPQNISARALKALAYKNVSIFHLSTILTNSPFYTYTTLFPLCIPIHYTLYTRKPILWTTRLSAILIFSSNVPFI